MEHLFWDDDYTIQTPVTCQNLPASGLLEPVVPGVPWPPRFWQISQPYLNLRGEERLFPPQHYYCPPLPRIFRPSYGTLHWYKDQMHEILMGGYECEAYSLSIGPGPPINDVTIFSDFLTPHVTTFYYNMLIHCYSIFDPSPPKCWWHNFCMPHTQYLYA